MKKSEYRECHRVSDAENAWLLYYDEAFCEDKNTKQEDAKHHDLGYGYTYDRDWYYQWDRDEKHYYVVVDGPSAPQAPQAPTTTSTDSFMEELDKWLEEI